MNGLKDVKIEDWHDAIERLENLSGQEVEGLLDVDAVRRRIRARNAARELIEYDVPDVLKSTKVDELLFWEKLAVEAATRCGMKVIPENGQTAMDDMEAAAFERGKAASVLFPQFKGKKVREVPPSFWIQVTENGFMRRLARYVRSSRFQQKQY